MTNLRALVVDHPGALAPDAEAALAAIDRGDLEQLREIVAHHQRTLDRDVHRYWQTGVGQLDVLRRERRTLDALARAIEDEVKD